VSAGNALKIMKLELHFSKIVSKHHDE